MRPGLSGAVPPSPADAACAAAAAFLELLGGDSGTDDAPFIIATMASE